MVTCPILALLVASASANPDDVLWGALEQEMQRTKTMHLEDYPPPYFVAFALEDVESGELYTRDGQTLRSSHDHTRPLYVEVRVGDYKLDNTAGATESSD